MEFPDIILVAVLIVSVPLIVHSWKNPLYLIPLYALFLGDIFGQVDLSERLFVQVFEGVRLYLRDFIVILMLFHVMRQRDDSDRLKRAVFGGAISVFLLFLVGNLVVKFLAFGGDFDGKVTPFIRLFSTFTIYFLVVRYLRAENYQAFLVSCYVVCIASVLIFLGYILLIIPIPTGLLPVVLSSSEGGGQPVRFGLPNALFVLFPYFMATAHVFSKAGNGRAIEKLTVLSMTIGSALGLFRMYLFIVLFGALLAIVRGRERLMQRLAIASVLAIGLFFTVQLVSEAKESGIVEAFIGRVSGTAEEFGDEEGSAGGRLVRTYAAIGQLMQPEVLLLGTVFTKEFSIVTAFASADLGVVATVLEYGLPALVLLVFVYRKGISAALVLEKQAGLLGQSARALLLFMAAVLPAVFFMYNPMQSEMMIALWATFLGTFDAMRLSNNLADTNPTPKVAQ